MLKKVAEAVANLTIIVFCGCVLLVIGYVISQHITCVDIINKFCVIH